MALLIDGYNLLHATGIVGSPRGGAALEKSRTALLNFLARAVDETQRPQTTVVFDAKEAPPGLPRTVQHRGLTVRFAAECEEADELIEQLIQCDSAPRRLTVVSSDHRIQRAARRRRARAIDSDRWYAQILRQQQTPESAAPSQCKPPAPLSPDEVQWWLDKFDQPMQHPATDQSAGESSSRGQTQSGPNNPPAATEPAKADDATGSDASSAESPADNPYHPFPPGYAEDVIGDR